MSNPKKPPQATEGRAPEPGTFTPKPLPSAPPTGTYAQQAIDANNARMTAAQAGPAQAFRRDEAKQNNLPTLGRFTAQLEAANAIATDKSTVQTTHRADPANRKWLKIGLQPAAGGFVLHTEYWVGDAKVRETVQKNLSALAAREKLALHMAAISQVF